MDDSKKGKESFRPKQSSTFLIWERILEYFPHVDTAKEAFDVDTNSGITDCGKSNLSKDAGV